MIAQTFGPAPANVKPIQTTHPDYSRVARAECQRYLDQIANKFPEHANRLKIIKEDGYLEVGIKIRDDSDWEAYFEIEKDLPLEWES